MKYYIIEEKGKLRLIPKDRLLINRDTPFGDPSDFYEIKSNGEKETIKAPIASIEINGIEVSVGLIPLYYMEFDRFITFS